MNVAWVISVSHPKMVNMNDVPQSQIKNILKRTLLNANEIILIFGIYIHVTYISKHAKSQVPNSFYLAIIK